MAHKTNLTTQTFFGLLWWHDEKTYFDIFIPLSIFYMLLKVCQIGLDE
jgi:hypothetical protein